METILCGKFHAYTNNLIDGTVINGLLVFRFILTTIVHLRASEFRESKWWPYRILWQKHWIHQDCILSQNPLQYRHWLLAYLNGELTAVSWLIRPASRIWNMLVTLLFWLRQTKCYSCSWMLPRWKPRNWSFNQPWQNQNTGRGKKWQKYWENEANTEDRRHLNWTGLGFRIPWTPFRQHIRSRERNKTTDRSCDSSLRQIQ